MGIFSPFDDNKDINSNETTKRRNRFIKNIIRYIVILIIWHLAATVLYAVCFSSLMEQYLRANMITTVDIILGIYSTVAIFCLAFFSSAQNSPSGASL